jgi:hypothetical protein
VRKGASGDLTGDDRKALALLVETLKKSPEDIAADEAVITEYAYAVELGTTANGKTAAAKAAGRARDEFAAEVERKNKEFALQQQTLIAAVSPVQFAASEALAAKERAEAMAKKHWAILGLPQPPAAPVPTPPQMNVARPPAPPLSPKEVEAAAQRNAANARLNRPICGPSMESIGKQTMAQMEDIRKARPAVKAAASANPYVDPAAKQAWLDAQVGKVGAAAS